MLKSVSVFACGARANDKTESLSYGVSDMPSSSTNGLWTAFTAWALGCEIAFAAGAAGREYAGAAAGGGVSGGLILAGHFIRSIERSSDLTWSLSWFRSPSRSATFASSSRLSSSAVCKSM